MIGELIQIKFKENIWQVNLFSFLWKILLNGNTKTMTSKKLRSLLTKIVLFISYYFSKNLTCASFYDKYLKKHFLIKLNIKKIFSEYIWRKLKYHQHNKKLNWHFIRNFYAFKCLIVSLVPLNSYFGNSNIFCLF